MMLIREGGGTDIQKRKDNIMLRQVKDFGSFKLRVCDGDIGKVREFYFANKVWTFRTRTMFLA